MRDCPPFGAQGVPPSLLHVFFCCCLFSLFFFSFYPGWGQSVQGAMLIWPRVVCGSTACCLAHLVVCFSWASKSWHLEEQKPSWFLRLTWCGDAMHGVGVWRSWSFASSWWFFLQRVSPVSRQDFILRSMLSASSLYSPSWNPISNMHCFRTVGQQCREQCQNVWLWCLSYERWQKKVKSKF
jgi:hypothetical protein